MVSHGVTSSILAFISNPEISCLMEIDINPNISLEEHFSISVLQPLFCKTPCIIMTAPINAPQQETILRKAILLKDVALGCILYLPLDNSSQEIYCQRQGKSWPNRDSEGEPSQNTTDGDQWICSFECRLTLRGFDHPVIIVGSYPPGTYHQGNHKYIEFAFVQVSCQVPEQIKYPD